MSDFLDQSTEQPQRKRPVFLTVLCILTFVSCGLGVLSSVYGLTVSGNAAKQMQSQQRMMQRMGHDQDNPFLDEAIDSAQKIESKQTLNSLLSLGNSLLCLAGALLMWRLRKSGYFIYVIGQTLPFISLIIMYPLLQDSKFIGPLMLIGYVVMAFFSLAFIVMYGLNLKHMR